MSVSAKIKYTIKIKGVAPRTVGPITLQVKAKTESAVMEEIRRREYASTKPVESIIILRIQ
jgi:hypothetical protein